MDTEYLIDTCVFINMGNNPELLSKKQKDVLENWENILHISTASAFEIATKVKIGKLKLNRNTEDFWSFLIDKYEIQVHSIETKQALSVEHLPFDNDHRDPFDRLIAGLARQEGLTVLSTDEAFEFYGCSVIN